MPVASVSSSVIFFFGIAVPELENVFMLGCWVYGVGRVVIVAENHKARLFVVDFGEKLNSVSAVLLNAAAFADEGKDCPFP